MTKLIIISQLCIFLFVCSCGGDYTPFDKAKKQIEEQDYKNALSTLNNIVKEHPTYDSAFLKRAYVYMMLGDKHSALYDYNQMMSNPSFKKIALEGRAMLFYNFMDYENALVDYNNLIKIDKNNFSAYYGRGIVKTQLKIYGNNPDVSSQGTMSDNEGTFYCDYNGAFLDYEKAIELNPNFEDTYVKRGNLFVILNKLDKALEDYNKAIKINSSF